MLWSMHRPVEQQFCVVLTISKPKLIDMNNKMSWNIYMNSFFKSGIGSFFWPFVIHFNIKIAVLWWIGKGSPNKLKKKPFHFCRQEPHSKILLSSHAFFFFFNKSCLSQSGRRAPDPLHETAFLPSARTLMRARYPAPCRTINYTM